MLKINRFLSLILSTLLIVPFINSMKIDRVILSTDSHPCYIEFWPMIAKAWNKMGVTPTLALVADKNVKVDETLGHVIRFEPIPDIPTGFQAQVIRLFLPMFFEEEVSLTSDIDMLPLNKDFLLGSVADITDDKFVVYSSYSDHYRIENEIFPICYLAATGKTFKDVFGIQNIEEISDLIKYWYKLSSSLIPPVDVEDKAKWSRQMIWSTDERMLTAYLKTWKDNNSRCIKLGNAFDHHIDRNDWKYSPELLKKGYYHEAHLPKPYFEPLNKKAIDQLLKYADLEDLIPEEKE